MPRNPIGGFVSGVFGLAWAALGLVAAAFAATATIDVAQAFQVAQWALERSPFELRWTPEQAALFAAGHLPWVAAAAAVALLFAWSNLRAARVAFRPATESDDGKGEIQSQGMAGPRVGRPFEGAIRLLREPTPGEDFNVRLTCAKAGAAAPAYSVEHRVRARQGAHGVNLPFRFEVPATAPASGGGHRWRLDFGPVERKLFGRSSFEVKLAPAPETEVRAASRQHVEAHVPATQAAPVLESAACAPAHAHGYVEHIEKLYGTLGGKLTERQRELLRAKLSGPEAQGMKQQLEAVKRIQPQHVRILKYAFIGFIVLFFVLPFVLSILGAILAAIFGQ